MCFIVGHFLEGRGGGGSPGCAGGCRGRRGSRRGSCSCGSGGRRSQQTKLENATSTVLTMPGNWGEFLVIICMFLVRLVLFDAYLVTWSTWTVRIKLDIHWIANLYGDVWAASSRSNYSNVASIHNLDMDPIAGVICCTILLNCLSNNLIVYPQLKLFIWMLHR